MILASMAKLTSKTCPNCGAPMVLTPGVSDLPCQYCGNVIHVEWGKKAPPAAPPLTVYVKPPSFGGLPLIIVLATLIPVAVPLYLAFAPKLTNLANEVAATAGVVTQTFPLTCGLNQEVSVIGRTFEGTGTLITGDINCKIRIKDSKLKGDVVVQGKNLVEITLENSTIEGAEAAVKLGMNSKVYARKNSLVKGGEVAVAGGINSELHLEDSAVEGKEAGVRADVNFKLNGTRSRIIGAEYGVVGSSNLAIEGRELSISGGKSAVEAEVGLKAALRGGIFEGGEAAIRSKGPNTHLKLSQKARLTAKENALDTQNNLELDMEDALIDGGEMGIETGVNPKLRLGHNARIVGKNVAVKAGVNFELTMRGASIESDRVAVCAPFNVEIEARESVIRGGSDAFRFQRRPQELTLDRMTVSGAQLFNAQGCAPSRKR